MNLDLRSRAQIYFTPFKIAICFFRRTVFPTPILEVKARILWKSIESIGYTLRSCSLANDRSINAWETFISVIAVTEGGNRQ